MSYKQVDKEDWKESVRINTLEMIFLLIILGIYTSVYNNNNIIYSWVYIRQSTYNIYYTQFAWCVLFCILSPVLTSTITKYGIGTGIPDLRGVFNGIVNDNYLSLRASLSRYVGNICCLLAGLGGDSLDNDIYIYSSFIYTCIKQFSISLYIDKKRVQRLSLLSPLLYRVLTILSHLCVYSREYIIPFTSKILSSMLNSTLITPTDALPSPKPLFYSNWLLGTLFIKLFTLLYTIIIDTPSSYIYPSISIGALLGRIFSVYIYPFIPSFLIPANSNQIPAYFWSALGASSYLAGITQMYSPSFLFFFIYPFHSFSIYIIACSVIVKICTTYKGISFYSFISSQKSIPSVISPLAPSSPLYTYQYTSIKQPPFVI
ncbi:hypothetical protein WA158_006310 [Blastocystis sp. Blastoise]